MKKKITKETLLTEKVRVLQKELSATQNDLHATRTTLGFVRDALGLADNYTTTHSDIVKDVYALVQYRKFHEGSYRPAENTVGLLQEIIRWQINPKTAEGIPHCRPNCMDNHLHSY